MGSKTNTGTGAIAIRTTIKANCEAEEFSRKVSSKQCKPDYAGEESGRRGISFNFGEVGFPLGKLDQQILNCAVFGGDGG